MPENVPGEPRSDPPMTDPPPVNVGLDVGLDAHSELRPLSDVSESRLWEMLESAPDGMVMTDASGVIVIVNRQIESMFGYDRGELLGQPIEFLLPERYRGAHVAHRERYRDDPVIRFMGGGLDLWAKRSDGSEFPVEISLSPSNSADGVEEVIASVRDVSDRSDVEARLREAQVKFRGAFDDGPIPMALVEITQPANRVIIEANPAMAALLGYQHDALVGLSFADLTHPGDRVSDDAAAAQFAAGELDHYSPIKRYLRADGSTVWVQLHASPLALGDGSTLGVAHVIDISKQLEALEALERRQALDNAVSMVRLAMLQGASADQGLTLICKAAAESLLADRALVLTAGTKPEVLDVAASFNVGVDATRALSFRASEGVVGEVFRSGEAQICGPDDPRYTPGNRAVIELDPVESIVVAPMHDGSGVVGVLLVTRSAGSSPLSEQDLMPIQAFASEAVVAIELAAASAAHQRLELLEDRERIGRDMHDNVIGRLFGTGMNLQATASRADGDLQDRLLAAVDEIDATITEIRSAIYGVRGQLDWGKGLRGEILAVASEATEALGFEAKVDLEGSIDDLQGDAAEALLATLREALTNATKHAEASRIDVSVRNAGSRVELIVADNGVGLGLEGTIGGASRMSGHGLANMKARAESLGGAASVESDAGQGAVVRWTIPLPQG